RHVPRSVDPCLLRTHTENIAEGGVGRTGEVDAGNRHTRMRRIDGDDRLINLEVTILVIREGRPAGTDIGAAHRPLQNRLGMRAALATVALKTKVQLAVCFSAKNARAAAVCILSVFPEKRYFARVLYPKRVGLADIDHQRTGQIKMQEPMKSLVNEL